MSKVKEWACDRCGAKHVGHPYSVGIVQVDVETGEPTRLYALSRRYKQIPQVKLCKDCADEVVEFIRGGW